MYKPKPGKNRDLMRYAGLGAQILVSLGIAVFAGYKVDKWLNLKVPIGIWLFPLLVLSAMIYKLVKDTSTQKPKHAKKEV